MIAKYLKYCDSLENANGLLSKDSLIPFQVIPKKLGITEINHTIMVTLEQRHVLNRILGEIFKENYRLKGYFSYCAKNDAAALELQKKFIDEASEFIKKYEQIDETIGEEF